MRLFNVSILIVTLYSQYTWFYYQLDLINKPFMVMLPMADPGGEVADVGDLHPLGPNSFIFTQFSAKCMLNNR